MKGSKRSQARSLGSLSVRTCLFVLLAILCVACLVWYRGNNNMHVQQQQRAKLEALHKANAMASVAAAHNESIATLVHKISKLERLVERLDQQDKQHADHHKEFVDPNLHRHEAALPALPSSNSNSNNLRGQQQPQQQQQVPLPLPPPLEEGKELDETTLLLVLASSNRPEYLKRCLEHVVKYLPARLPVVVSEDGANDEVARVVTTASPKLIHVHHPFASQPAENGYFKLCAHFKWAISEVFAKHNQVQRLIILEEDLEVAPDFFDYFGALAPLLDEDKSLLTISAWNDNGQARFVKNEQALYRSDFFPGLGWMLTRRLWQDELAAKWPRAYWDDWLREPAQRKGRHTIRPEVCRTLHFGKRGVSNAQFGDYLNEIKLNDVRVHFASLDLTYLKEQEWNREYVQRRVKTEATLVTTEQLTALGIHGGNAEMGGKDRKEYRLEYNTLSSGRSSFVSLANWAGCMDNIKANVPRTAYQGIVTIWLGNTMLHIAPSSSFSSSS